MNIDSKNENQKSPGGATKTVNRESLIQRIINFFFNRNNPAYERKRLLKDISKSLRKMHTKYYSPKNQYALPGLAKLFYEFYKTLGPAQTLVQNADSSGALKLITIESFLDDKQFQLKSRFNEKEIRERVQYSSPKKVAQELKDELVTYFAIYDTEKTKLIDSIYVFLQHFLSLVHFDYYFLIKKFDASLPEGNFFYKPNFEAINGEYIVDELKDFLDITYNMDRQVNWDSVLDILKDYRSVEIVSRNGFRKLISRIKEIKRNRALELIIKHIEGDPYYKPRPISYNSRIVEPYLSKLKTQTDLIIQKLSQEKRSKNIEDLCMQIFGTTSVSRMKNYTEKANEQFKKKMIGGFIYVTPLNFLKAFLIDYNKKDVREVVDLLLVRGKWTANILSQKLSDCFNQLMEITDRLLQFDERLVEDGPIRINLKKALLRVEKDAKNARDIRQMLKEINDEAKSIVYESAQNLISLGKNLKQILDDYSANPHNLIINWKEIDTFTDNRIKKQVIEIYKKIYYFIKLLQYYSA
ncbi:MAG: hypothetical protein JW969_14050 [Spirochaetales bacterium]|nr:hypothetical protein [Spirochaetales bacterium]